MWGRPDNGIRHSNGIRHLIKLCVDGLVVVKGYEVLRFLCSASHLSQLHSSSKMYLKPSNRKHFYLWHSISSFLSKTVESVQLHVCVRDAFNI